MYFDGVDDNVAISNPLAGGGAYTLMAWVLHRKRPVDFAGALWLGKAAVAKGTYIGSYYNAGTGWKWTGGLYGANLYSMRTVAPGTWVRIVLTHLAGAGALYINANTPVTGAIAANIEDLTGSLGQIGAAYRFGGDVLDPRVYTRAISPAEVAADFRGEWIDSTGLARHWPCEAIVGGKTRERVLGTDDTVTGAVIDTDRKPWAARTAAGARVAA